MQIIVQTHCNNISFDIVNWPTSE